MDASPLLHPTARGRLLAAAALVATSCAQAAAAARPVAELRVQAEVSADTILVGDVAALQGVSAQEGQRLARLALGPAPRTGQVGRVNRAQLLAALPAGWAVEGAAAAKVVRAAQPLDGDRLCAVAVAAAEPRLDSLGPAIHHALDCAADNSRPIDVPQGPLALSADLSHLQLVDGPQRANVDVMVAGRAERSVAVTLKLSLQAQQWCARTPVASGQVLQPSSFDGCLVPVRHPAQLDTAGAPLPAGRMRRALHAGDVLAAADVAGIDTALAGDAVEVRYRVGGFELESRGALLQDARVGDPVRVRLSQATQPVIGHLASGRLVELEDQP